MYHSIVKRKIQSLFEDVNAGNAENVINGFTKDFIHTFVAAGAMGGRRNQIESVRKWYDRLYKLLPDIKFNVLRIEISGPPWNTIAYVHWHETNSGTDGVFTENYGYHVVKIIWGKMKELIICPDAIVLGETLTRLAQSGNKYATLPPIADLEN